MGIRGTKATSGNSFCLTLSEQLTRSPINIDLSKILRIDTYEIGPNKTKIKNDDLKKKVFVKLKNGVSINFSAWFWEETEFAGEAVEGFFANGETVIEFIFIPNALLG